MPRARILHRLHTFLIPFLSIQRIKPAVTWPFLKPSHLLSLLAIFIFGGESIRGFMFALIIGVMVGTYSSVFIATPIMFDSYKNKD